IVLLAAGLWFGLWLGRERGEPRGQKERTAEEWLEQLRSEDQAGGAKAWQGLGGLGGQGLPVLVEAPDRGGVRGPRPAGLGGGGGAGEGGGAGRAAVDRGAAGRKPRRGDRGADRRAGRRGIA